RSSDLRVSLKQTMAPPPDPRFEPPDPLTREEQGLAPWAMRTRLSKGRRHPEEPHPFRTLYMRDRDRIVHSTAFRRLMYKTQVLVTQTNDYHRTRLTHTLEVAQISRTIARQLGLNEDLTEVPFWQQTVERVLRQQRPGPEQFQPTVVRALIDWQVTDLLEHTWQRLRAGRVRSVEDVRNAPGLLVNPGPDVLRLKAGLEE